MLPVPEVAACGLNAAAPLPVFGERVLTGANVCASDRAEGTPPLLLLIAAPPAPGIGFTELRLSAGREVAAPASARVGDEKLSAEGVVINGGAGPVLGDGLTAERELIRLCSAGGETNGGPLTGGVSGSVI